MTGDFYAIKRVEMIDQQPSESSRSNPVTYIKAYDAIRTLYSKLPKAQSEGYKPKAFSFNVDGGRCDECKGDGFQIVEMQFLADVRLECETCKGQRFKDEILDVTYKGKSIYDVLSMTVDEAMAFFTGNAEIRNKTKATTRCWAGLCSTRTIKLYFIWRRGSKSQVSLISCERTGKGTHSFLF